jgi:hypothetical protein
MSEKSGSAYMTGNRDESQLAPFRLYAVTGAAVSPPQARSSSQRTNPSGTNPERSWSLLDTCKSAYLPVETSKRRCWHRFGPCSPDESSSTEHLAVVEKSNCQEQKWEAQPQTAALPGGSSPTETLNRRFVGTAEDPPVQSPELDTAEERERQSCYRQGEPITESEHVA